jgi:hypothetical protein
MILVRDIFQLKFGKARDALAALKEGLPIMKKGGYTPERVLTDFTGDFYTLIMESKYKDLAEYEKALKGDLGMPEWKKWYEKFIPLVESGRREILTIVEL